MRHSSGGEESLSLTHMGDLTDSASWVARLMPAITLQRRNACGESTALVSRLGLCSHGIDGLPSPSAAPERRSMAGFGPISPPGTAVEQCCKQQRGGRVGRHP